MPPMPKRTEERRRRNQPEGLQVSKAPGAAKVRVPSASKDWHPFAREWYLSLRRSGQSRFYEDSDWQTARVLAEILSTQLASGRPSAVLMQVWQSGATELLTTEGARRRVRIELERAPAESTERPAGVVAMDDYRDALGG